MKELVTELLREKFVIHDPSASLKDGKGMTIALSNRVVIALKNDKGETQETMIVRAQNMHSCIRMAARMIQSFISSGPLLDRASPYDWLAAWDLSSGDYEQSFNPQRWVAVYKQGKVIFEKGERHAMLDIIENCNVTSKAGYEKSIEMAEAVIRKSGRAVRIEYDGNIALNVNLEQKQGRVGVILRSPHKTTTFNFSVAGKNGALLNFPQVLGSAAAFLEGIQLAFTVGMNGEKIRRGMITRHSPEEKHTNEAGRRLARLNGEIINLEGTFDVRYRPERPEFQRLVAEAEAMAQKILPAPGKKT